MFHIGQKVVCVDDRGVTRHLKRGDIYDVLAIDGPCWLHVNAWANSNPDGNGWSASRFRPVIERKTDILIFNEIRINVGKGKVKHNELV